MKKVFFVVSGAIYMLVAAFLQLPDGRFHVYFLNIGQGDSVLIQTPENYYILVDGGPENTVLEELSETMPFFVKKIDMIVLSHPHSDHLDGLVEVLKRYDVDLVLLSGIRAGGGSYEEFWREIKSDNFVIAESDYDFMLGETLIDTVYPSKSMGGMEIDNLNNSSVAIRVVYGDKVILLTGDLEVEGEESLAKSGVPLKADVFKAGHHGSDTSSTPELLSRVLPKIVVIQCGQDNSYGHPKAETLMNYHKFGVQKIYRNDIDGRVEIVF